MSIRKARTVLQNAVLSVLIGVLLLGPLPFQAQAQVTSIDMIYLVDESGSMGGEQAWLAQQVPLIDQELITNGITNNMYGLVGYGNSARVPRQVDVAGGQFGTAAEFATAIGTLQTNGGTEDGYAAMDFAINNYQFRAGVGAILVLVTDEDRDILSAGEYPAAPNLDYNSMLAALQARNINMTSILDQDIFKADGQTVALVMNGGGAVSVADGAGGLTPDSPSANGVFGNGDGNTTADYADMSQALQSCVGDLNQLRQGGATGESFAIAFIQCVATAAENQAPVQPGGLTPYTVTPGAVGMMTAAAMSMIHLPRVQHRFAPECTAPCRTDNDQYTSTQWRSRGRT